MSPQKFLYTYLAPQRGAVFLLAALILSGISFQLFNPQLIRYFLDTLQAHGAETTLTWVAGWYLALALIQQGVLFAASLVSQNVAWRATNALRRDLLLHSLRLDLAFHHDHAPGELIERLEGDVNELATFFSEFVVRVVGNGLLVVGILGLLYREDWRVGVGLTGYVGLTFALLSLTQAVAVKYWTEARQASAAQYSFIEERLIGAEDLRANGAVPYSLYRLQQLMRRFLEKYRAAYTLRTVLSNFTNVLAVTGYALGLALGVYLFRRGEASLGTAYLIVNYAGMLAVPLQNIRAQLQGWQQALASLTRVSELLQFQPLVKSQSSHTPPLEALSVEFDQVEFGYADRDQVLQAVSFKLRPGRVLGVLGRTGSGKSTLARLLFRLYDPKAGVIRLQGTDLRALALESVRAQVGMVTQEVQLFQATLRDNLTFFNAQISDDHILRTLRALRLGDWLQQQPQGLDTELETGGRGLSAGEAQLLAFTRVFLKNPGVVILDEASSRLDPATETLVERAVDQLFQNRTGVIIAHRLPTVERADDILILEHGRIVEFGERVQLLADPHSHFNRLLNTDLQEALA